MHPSCTFAIHPVGPLPKPMLPRFAGSASPSRVGAHRGPNFGPCTVTIGFSDKLHELPLRENFWCRRPLGLQQCPQSMNRKNPCGARSQGDSTNLPSEVSCGAETHWNPINSTGPTSEEPLWCRKPLELQQIMLLMCFSGAKTTGTPTNPTSCTYDETCGAGNTGAPQTPQLPVLWNPVVQKATGTPTHPKNPCLAENHANPKGSSQLEFAPQGLIISIICGICWGARCFCTTSFPQK